MKVNDNLIIEILSIEEVGRELSNYIDADVENTLIGKSL